MLPQELPYFTLNGTTDMFWPKPMDMSAINQHCSTTPPTTLRPPPNLAKGLRRPARRGGEGGLRAADASGLLDKDKYKYKETGTLHVGRL